jgi:hypothetical protein
MVEEERQAIMKMKKFRKITPCRLLFLEGTFNLLRLTFLIREYEEKFAACQENMAIILYACQQSATICPAF